MQPDERLAADEPDDVSERPRVLVQDGLCVEKGLVPRDTAIEVGDCQSDMSDRRKLGHGAPPQPADSGNLVWDRRLNRH